MEVSWRARSFAVLLGAAVIFVTATALPCGTVLGRYDFGTHNRKPNDVSLATIGTGSYALTADAYGLTVWNVSDPAHPSVSGEVLLPSPGLSVAVTGSTAVVTAGSSGVYIVNVGDPVHPVVSGHLGGFWARSVAVSGTVAYVETTSSNIVPVNIATPTDPQAGTPFWVHQNVTGFVSLATNGDVLFAAVSDPAFFESWDLSTDPMAPVHEGELDLADEGLSGQPVDVAAWDDFVVLAMGTGGYALLDVQTLNSPSLADTSNAAPFSDLRGVAIDGGTVAFAGGDAGVVFARIQTGAIPVLVQQGSLALGQPADACAFDGTPAVLPGADPGLLVGPYPRRTPFGRHRFFSRFEDYLAAVKETLAEIA